MLARCKTQHSEQTNYGKLCELVKIIKNWLVFHIIFESRISDFLVPQHCQQQ